MGFKKMLALVLIAVGSVPAWLAAGEKAAGPRAGAIPVIFDTDIGDDFDDTWALLMVVKSPQFDVKLVTTTCGKSEYRAKIIAKMLTVAGRTDIPVGLGEGGRNGVGGQQPWVKDYKLTDYPGKVYQDGAGAVIDVIKRSPRPVTVICVGPLHTMAAVLERDPGIATKASFAGMHGSVRKGYGGGSKIDAEYNVKANAPAAQKVLSAPWRQITITPVDTCAGSMYRASVSRRSKPAALRSCKPCWRTTACGPARRASLNSRPAARCSTRSRSTWPIPATNR